MHALTAWLLAVAAATAIARPPGEPRAPAIPLPHRLIHQPRPFLGDYILPRILLRNPYGYEDSPAIMPAPESEEHDWLNKEIDRLNLMEEEEQQPLTPFEMEFSRWMSQDPYIPQPYAAINPNEVSHYIPEITPGSEGVQPPKDPAVELNLAPKRARDNDTASRQKEIFALTPLQPGYYEPDDSYNEAPTDHHHEGNILSKTIILEPPRQTRQNPISRTKNLVADNLDRLKAGFTRQEPDTTDRTYPRVLEPLEAGESVFGLALIAAVGAALTIAIFGFAFGWYTLSKKAKAAADVDYPAYGVTGPNIDISGDRKLAHSAHMYHYQHQKQQIIAMERSGLEQRNGSVSDPESEEENEEGDYTVYECPGFATTGEMEVKNPLFSEDPTPATPGKCELVKPQPKD